MTINFLEGLKKYFKNLQIADSKTDEIEKILGSKYAVEDFAQFWERQSGSIGMLMSYFIHIKLADTVSPAELAAYKEGILCFPSFLESAFVEKSRKK